MSAGGNRSPSLALRQLAVAQGSLVLLFGNNFRRAPNYKCPPKLAFALKDHAEGIASRRKDINSLGTSVLAAPCGPPSLPAHRQGAGYLQSQDKIS